MVLSDFEKKVKSKKKSQQSDPSLRKEKEFAHEGKAVNSKNWC